MRCACPARPGRFDFAFIDAAKPDYLAIFASRAKLVNGAVVIADNTGAASGAT